MTVRAPGTPALTAPAPAGTSSAAELQTVSGVVLGGSLCGDVIIASAEALAIVRAGLLVRAFVIAGMDLITKTVAVGGGRAIRLAFGVYRAVR